MSVIIAQTHLVYWSYMVSFMSYRDQLNYGPTHHFSDEEPTSITPTDIEQYMKFKSYGVPVRGADDCTTKLRASTLIVMNKTISFFIPHRKASWDPG
jgi:hypothetical protein